MSERSLIDEAFADPERAKEMYFYRCLLAHEREDLLNEEITSLRVRLAALENIARIAGKCEMARRRVVAGPGYDLQDFWLTFEDELVPALSALPPDRTEDGQ